MSDSKNPKIRNIKVLIAYDGTDFCGWQVQKNGRTVQAIIEEALQKLHDHPVHIHGAGRTDSGVHAAGQVGNFISGRASIPAEKFCPALNSLLPRDVRILKSAEADDSFHARYSARARTYQYYLYPGGIRHPMLRNFCYQVKRQLNMTLLNEFSARLLGEHDFTAFSAPLVGNASPYRNIQSAGFFQSRGFTVFFITGNAFLMRMVRSIVGTLLELEMKNATPDAVTKILESRDRKLVGVTAPAKGLFLHKVTYS